MQPGGHADGDENIFAVAVREGNEETGIQKLIGTEEIFDIDIHTIPARKDFPEHFHSHHNSPGFLFSSAIKNGPPSNAVITPTGISVGDKTMRAAVSHNTRKAAPKKKAAVKKAAPKKKAAKKAAKKK